MRILSICASKGGVGKTTLTAALTVAALADGYKVGIIDLDPQESASFWAELRSEVTSEDDRPLVETNPDVVEEAVDRLADAGCEVVFVDTPPALMTRLERAVEIASTVLIPAQTSSLDLFAINPVSEYARARGKDFVFVLTRVDGRDEGLNRGSANFLKVRSGGGEVLKETIGNRKAFKTCMADGIAGPEMSDAKAREEIEALWRVLKRRLGLKSTKAA